MTKHCQDFSFCLSYPLLLLFFLCSLPFAALSQCPGTSCTYTISGPDSGTYTVNNGEKICFDLNAIFTGTVNLYGGELHNCATNSQVFTFSTSSANDNGVINNYGIIDFGSNVEFKDSLIVNNYNILNVNGNLNVRNGATYFNDSNSTITGDVHIQGLIDNYETLIISGDLTDSSSGELTNLGQLNANNWTARGAWTNLGTITITNSFSQFSSSFGTIDGGCLTSNSWINRGTITGVLCGDINIATTSELTSSGFLLGDIAVIDQTPPSSAPFIDIQNGTVGSNIIWTSCYSCGQEEICNNGIDDDGDGYTDGDDPDCITAGSCGCPPGGTVITDLPFGYSVPAGSSHCLDADETLNSAWNNVNIIGNLYILGGNTLTINMGDIFFDPNASIIICDGATYINESASSNPYNIYNYGLMEVCGNSSDADIDKLISGDNSLTIINADYIYLNDTIIYHGNPGGNAYLYIDPVTAVNGISSGNVCLPGNSDINVELNDPSITPTCVTDCNGCPELSTISGICNDGTAVTTYNALNASTLEICANGNDDNGDGRIDEPFPGGVQSDMQLWLKADQGTSSTFNGDPINAWNDQSIHAYSANVDVNATSFPSFNQNAINFNPGINFSGNYIDDFSDGLHLGSDYIFSNNDEMNVFAVVAPNADGERDNYVFDFGLHAGAGYGLSYSDTHYGSYSSGFQDETTHLNGEEPSLLSLNINFGLFRTQYRNGVFLDMQQITSLTELDANNIDETDSYGVAATSGPFSIGRKSASTSITEDGGNIFYGEISEIIVFNNALSSQEEQQIQSYLGIKYGITLAHNYLSSSGISIKGISDGHTNNIVGIGRDDCSSLNQKQSKSVEDDGIVTLSLGAIAANNQSNPGTFSADENFLMIGNDGQTVDTWSPVGGSSSDSRINRTWKINNTNISQNITFTIDMDDLENDIAALTPGALSDYKIMFDLDGDFTNGGSLTTSLNNTTGSLYEITLDPGSWQYFTIVHEELVPVDEICNNSIDDNGDGRIDEAFPGGVQQDMQLWLKAEVGTNTDVDGNDVISWGDQSVNAYSANADVNSTDDPTFSENAINFNPGIDFDGTFTDGFSDGLHLGSDYIYADKDGLHVFIVCDTDVTPGTDKQIFDFGLQANGGYGMIYSDNDYGMYTNNSFGGTNTELFHSEGEDPALVEMKVDFDDAQEFYRNGDLLSSIAVTIPDLVENKVNEAPAFGPVANSSGSGPVTIGRKSASVFLDLNGGRLFDGRISEVIVFTDTLSSVEKQKVNSYLAIKYGITTQQHYLASTGALVKDVLDGYGNNIAGIGRDDCSGLHQKQSKSVEPDAIVTIGMGTIASTNQTNSNSIPTDVSFLNWGHDDSSGTSWNSSNVAIPGVDLASIDRTWKFTEESDITNTLFQIEVDNANFDLPPMPPTADGIYYLLRDDDGDFTNGGTTYEPLSLSSGDKWETVLADPTFEFLSIAVGNVCGAMAPSLTK